MRDSLKALLVTLSLTAAACGGSGGGGDDLGKFIGVWSPTSGTYSQTCPGDDYNTGTGQVTDTETWAMGTTSELVQTIAGSSFVLHADVSSNTASASPAGQTYSTSGSTTEGDSVTETTTYTAYTFVVNSDGLTATENLSGTLVLNFNTVGFVDNCTFTQTASYAKQ
jgi:hypothetical protein